MENIIKSFTDQLINTKLCFVPIDLIENFYSYCKKQNISPQGGAIDSDNKGQYFYID